MKRDNTCSQCDHKDNCRLVYEKLGRAKGENVAMRAMVAFLVPIGVFIGMLAAAGHLLQGRFGGRALTLVSFLLAVCVTLLVVFIIRAFNGLAKKEHSNKR